jgi:long-chain-fatty-acid--[acyl-carrier-protein] ligase
MLNWTVGSRAIDHAAEVTQLKDVFCSRRFLERLESLELGSVEDKLILLEDFRSSLSVKDKMRAFFLGLLKPQKLLQKLDLKSLDENEPAVILFTSGTEALPKGVPLSHKNILSNLRASYSFLGAQSSDILYAILPPFHSFGFSVTGILPLLLGLKVCYSPDPTDSRRMASDVDHWKATILCAAPSFLTGMFHVAKEGQLNSVRLVVSGAEKAPQELFDAVARLPDHAELIEGYGITECSPIVTINHLQAVHKGVGQALGNLKLCTINPETLALLPHGEEGEICIQGSSVFSGYLGEEKDPFIEIEGQKWYRSGDRGYIDVDGNLILSGRLKRFIKMGGEMVSLGGIEEDLTDAAKEKAWIPKSTQTPQLAISAKENEGGKPLIILYATFAISREAANEALKEKGAGRLVKIAEVRHVEEIPLSGTGKVQHRKLDQWV